MEDGFELWFTDLTPEAQQELLAYAEASAPEEMNWDIYPVVIIPC